MLFQPLGGYDGEFISINTKLFFEKGLVGIRHVYLGLAECFGLVELCDGIEGIGSDADLNRVF